MEIIYRLFVFNCLIQLVIVTNSHYNHSNILDYLVNLCKTTSEEGKMLYLINTFQTSLAKLEKQENNFEIQNFFLKIKCEHIYFSNVSFSAKIIDFFPKYKFFQHGQVQLIFDLTSFNELSKLFTQNLNLLSGIYSHCIACAPLIVLTNITHDENLIKWLNLAISSLKVDFRLVLISINGPNTNLPIYLRPILDGCFLHPGIFIPTNEHDFKRLFSTYTNCNLNSTKLDVLISDVSIN